MEDIEEYINEPEEEVPFESNVKTEDDEIETEITNLKTIASSIKDPLENKLVDEVSNLLYFTLNVLTCIRLLIGATRKMKSCVEFADVKESLERRSFILANVQVLPLITFPH